MSTTAIASSAGAADKLSVTGAPILRYVKTARAWISVWAAAYANSLAAAAIYESLSKLSDAELHRRGVSRSTLAHDVSRIVGRKQGWPDPAGKLDPSR